MLLPDAGATTVMTAIDSLARRVSCDDERTADQRRADAAVQLALNTLHGSTSDELPREHGLRPSVQVTVALSTLLGLDEQPGELDGSRPDPRLGRPPDRRRSDRDLAPTGHRRTRQVIRLRPQHLPATERPHRARHRERPHLPIPKLQPASPTLRPRPPTAWEQGGQTSAQNLNAICSRHHHAKHEAGWQPKRAPDGSIEWTSPTGHTYVEEPATYPVDHTTEASRPTKPNNNGPKLSPGEP